MSRSPRSAASPASALRSFAQDTTASEPSLDVLTVPNFASPLRGNLSLPALQTETLQEPATHVDANRLLMYQHKLNAKLTSENEMLKAQCDELRRLAQRGRDRREAHAPAAAADDSAAAAAEASALRRQVQELQEQLAESSRTPQAGHDWRMLVDMADILQGQHEQLLHEIGDTSNVPRAHLLGYMERLEKALNHAHGVINSMREYATAHPPAPASAPAAHASLSASLSRSVAPAEQSRLLEANGPDEMGAELVRMQQLVHTLADELHTARTKLDAAAHRSQEAVAAKARVEQHLAATLAELAQSKETVEGRARTLHRARERYTEASRSIDATHSDAGELAHLERALANAEEELAIAREEHQRIAQQRQLLDEQLGLAAKVRRPPHTPPLTFSATRTRAPRRCAPASRVPRPRRSSTRSSRRSRSCSGHWRSGTRSLRDSTATRTGSGRSVRRSSSSSACLRRTCAGCAARRSTMAKSCARCVRSDRAGGGATPCSTCSRSCGTCGRAPSTRRPRGTRSRSRRRI